MKFIIRKHNSYDKPCKNATREWVKTNQKDSLNKTISILEWTIPINNVKDFENLIDECDKITIERTKYSFKNIKYEICTHIKQED